MVSGEKVRFMLIMHYRQLENYDEYSSDLPVIEATLDAWWDISAEEVEKIYQWLKEI
jgi:hypothetical protein